MRLFNHVGFVENHAGEFVPPTIFITFVELERFTKGKAERKSYRDKLSHWIKNGETMKGEPGYTGDDREMQYFAPTTAKASKSTPKYTPALSS
ncbi:MAG: hypothetical protein ACI4TJ_02515 [Candidatus Cryptobacteroides sp.]